ncbi:hypothetical protein BDN72DRAFT_899909 [Pluteus cervinus]|uniref:Uncharacterized protein n=1 Tax=Pluteus cervinus TaxID=181527 RepID=A0ACD3AKB6_9AGAR|nr:hypothetical protein BDN72DRAFT_899909 [Pluteus cervinus]
MADCLSEKELSPTRTTRINLQHISTSPLSTELARLTESLLGVPVTSRIGIGPTYSCREEILCGYSWNLLANPDSCHKRSIKHGVRIEKIPKRRQHWAQHLSIANVPFTSAYVPGDLPHVYSELLKNSLHAVVGQFGMDKADLLPPIRVVVVEGKEDITIKFRMKVDSEERDIVGLDASVDDDGGSPARSMQISIEENG